MSTTSSTSPTSPLDRRDIRSTAQPFKRDKDHGSKWSNGKRPGAGVKLNYNTDSHDEELHAGSETQKEKVRPRKQHSQAYTDPKSHANKTPKPWTGSTWDAGRRGGRIAQASSAHFDAQDHSTSPLSRSLLELLPQHTNNNTPAITIIRQAPADSSILYSFDNKGPSPGDKANKVELGSLVEKAESRWHNEQTEKMVKVEYEVLDEEGETVLKKGKKSPKQKAVVGTKTQAVEMDVDGFELV